MDTPKLASIAVGIAFVIGVLYNYGYFVGLDLNFFTFLSYKDHLAVLVFFAGPCLVMALLCGVYRRKMPFLDYVAYFLAAVAIISWVERAEVAGLASLNAFLFWFRGISSFLLIPYLIAVIVSFFAADNWDKQDGRKYAITGISILGLIVFIVMFGNFRGHTDASSDHFEMEVTLASDEKIPSLPRPAHLVRAVDDGMFLILRDAPDRIAFVSKDEVKILSKKLQ
jgi:hypothetical protein